MNTQSRIIIAKYQEKRFKIHTEYLETIDAAKKRRDTMLAQLRIDCAAERAASPKPPTKSKPEYIDIKEENIRPPKKAQPLCIVPTEKKFLSLKETSVELGPTVRTLRSWIKQGKLQCVQIGKVYRVEKKVIDAMLEEGYKSATVSVVVRKRPTPVKALEAKKNKRSVA